MKGSTTSEAEIHGDYATLTDESGLGLHKDFTHSFERGIEVRVDDIVWCADAPDGN
jgi:hypothetical protein